MIETHRRYLEAAARNILYLGTIESRKNVGAVLVPPRDVDALAAAMQRVLEDCGWWSKLSRSGMERAASFRWEETARKVIECYRGLAEEGNEAA